MKPPSPTSQEPVEDGRIPEHHKRIPPEVLDPRVMIPPSKFSFRKRESDAASPSQETSSSRQVNDCTLCEMGPNILPLQPSQGTWYGVCSSSCPCDIALFSISRLATGPATIVDGRIRHSGRDRRGRPTPKGVRSCRGYASCRV